MMTYIVLGGVLIGGVASIGILILVAFRNVSKSATAAGADATKASIDQTAAERADAIAHAAAQHPTDDDVAGRMRDKSF